MAFPCDSRCHGRGGLLTRPCSRKVTSKVPARCDLLQVLVRVCFCLFACVIVFFFLCFWICVWFLFCVCACVCVVPACVNRINIYGEINWYIGKRNVDTQKGRRTKTEKENTYQFTLRQDYLVDEKLYGVYNPHFTYSTTATFSFFYVIFGVFRKVVIW